MRINDLSVFCLKFDIVPTSNLIRTRRRGLLTLLILGFVYILSFFCVCRFLGNPLTSKGAFTAAELSASSGSISSTGFSHHLRIEGEVWAFSNKNKLNSIAKLNSISWSRRSGCYSAAVEHNLTLLKFEGWIGAVTARVGNYVWSALFPTLKFMRENGINFETTSWSKFVHRLHLTDSNESIFNLVWRC